VIPRNWVVDRNGMLLKEQVGYGFNGAQWLDEATRTIEKIRSPQ